MRLLKIQIKEIQKQLGSNFIKKIFVNEIGFVIRWNTSLDLYNVENETPMFPTFIAIKNIKSTTSTNLWSKKEPILTFTKRYSIVLCVSAKQP